MSASGASAEFTVDLTTTETVVSKRTLTREEVDKLVYESWLGKFEEPVEMTTIPFECNGKTYSIQYHSDSDQVFMYEPVRAVYGDQAAVEWLVKKFFGYGVETPPHCVDWYLINVFEHRWSSFMLDKGRPINVYEKFVREHGSIQRAIETHCVTPEEATERAHQIFNGIVKTAFVDLQSQHQHSPDVLKQALKALIHNATSELFVTLEPSKRTRSD
mgnify:CR=1 FL=1